MLWDLNEAKHLYSLEAGDVVNALVFSPNRYWLCAATASCIKIFDLESKCVGSRSRNSAVTLMFVIFSGRLSTSSSQSVPTPARSKSQYVCQLPGQRTARRYLAVSPMTLFVSGALSRSCFVGPVVYYMACCTLKIDRCCIHVLRLSWCSKCTTRRFRVRPVRATLCVTFTPANATDATKRPCFHCFAKVTNTLLACVLVHPAEVYDDGTSGNVDL